MHFSPCCRRSWLYASLAGGAAVLLWNLYRERKTGKCCFSMCCGKKQDNVYETAKSVNEYLLMHFGEPTTLMPWDFGPSDALEFPKRCADLCKPLGERSAATDKLRVLDVGCAVGRSSFELAAYYDEVVGVDFSHAFIATANKLKLNGRCSYEALEEGEIYSKHEAVVNPDLDRSKVMFEQGDACNLRADLGTYDCVLAGNLICRLPEPRAFFERMKTTVRKGGLLVITSPYTFMTEYTKKEKWIGGFYNSQAEEVRAANVMDDILAKEFEFVKGVDMPFFIRETARKNQWTVADARVYKKL